MEKKRVCVDCGAMHAKGDRCERCSCRHAARYSPSAVRRTERNAFRYKLICRVCPLCGFLVKTRIYGRKKVIICPRCRQWFFGYGAEVVRISREAYAERYVS